MSTLTLSALHIYPIKSMGGITLDKALIEQRGFQYDRRWMLVDEEGVLLTQREYPTMALIAITVEANGLSLTAPKMEPLHIPFAPPDPTSLTVRVWRNVVPALMVNEAANAWFSRYLAAPCTLVYMPDDTRREINPDYAIDENSIVSFADGYPFLIVGESSLTDLNQRLERPLPMNRFRPNLVVTGSAPYAEDDWTQLRIGATLFYGVKQCNRCVIPTIDQATAERSMEPTRTLATYRVVDQNVMFGRYLIPAAAGSTLRLGDAVEIIA